MKNPYLLSLASSVPGVEKYVKTLEKLENTVQPVNVQFQPHFQKILSAAVNQHFSEGNMIINERPYPNNMHRWDFVPKDLDPQRYVVFTDTADVIFQKPLPSLGSDQAALLPPAIWVAEEGMLFKDNPFWKQLMTKYPKFEVLDDTPVYNAGCFAMPVKELYSWVQFLKDNCQPYEETPAVEMLLYNVWLQIKIKEMPVLIHPHLFACLYNQVALGKVIRRHDNVWVNEQDIPFTVVHANGNTKGMLSEYES